LDVKLKGKGWNFIALYTSLNPEFLYNINTASDDQTIVLPEQYLKENMGITSNIEVLEINPDTLIIQLDKYFEKYVTIIPVVNVETKEEYQVVGNIILEPDSVKIGGAYSLIDPLNTLNTQEITLANVNSNIYKAVKLTDSLSNIMWRAIDEVFVHIKVELSAEKEISDISLKIKDLPSDKDVILIPPQITLQLKGGVNQLSEYDKDNLNAYIYYQDVMTDTTGAVQPVINLQEGVKITSVKPDKIQYIIKKK
jgi:hypothetical protein